MLPIDRTNEPIPPRIEVEETPKTLPLNKAFEAQVQRSFEDWSQKLPKDIVAIVIPQHRELDKQGNFSKARRTVARMTHKQFGFQYLESQGENQKSKYVQLVKRERPDSLPDDILSTMGANSDSNEAFNLLYDEKVDRRLIYEETDTKNSQKSDINVVVDVD